jgi:glutamate 5-kinase
MSLNNLKTIVIKLGSTSLLDKTKRFRGKTLTCLAREIKGLNKKGINVVVVTSGAIALGAQKLGLFEKNKTIVEKQALAAIGQSLLMNEYQKIFSKYGLKVAQILLTQEDFAQRSAYLSARNTIGTLLDLGVVPVINENDSVAVEEIKVGDNDTLSALVAGLINADFLMIATDTEGLCRLEENTGRLGPVINEVKEINQELYRMCSGKSTLGTGGMTTKIRAAEIAAASGIPTKIFHSKLLGRQNLLELIGDCTTGTLFYPKEDKLEARKRWIAHGQKLKGKIVVDEGAFQVLTRGGKSLLPVGVKGASGGFQAGEAVSLVNLLNKEFARGISNYSAKEIEEIKGLKTTEVEKKLGYKISDEIIHRDNLVIL